LRVVGSEVCALERMEQSRLRVVFMGSDVFSLPSLEVCVANADVVAVFTQPDRRSGRGRKRLTASVVKQQVLDTGVRIEQPRQFDNASCETLRSLRPDLTVVAAYGQLLPPAALEVARLDSVNVHASLLPRHRGAAPVAAAILAGDRQAGVTLMKLRPRLDAGEILCLGADRTSAQRATPVGDDETSGELTARLAEIGGELLADALRGFADRSVTYETQDEARATYAPKLEKSDGRIDWRRPAEDIARQVRAMTPWPGAFTTLRAGTHVPQRVILLRARACRPDREGKPGRLSVSDDGRLIAVAGHGCVEVVRLKLAGRKAMSADEFLRGRSSLSTAPAQPGDWCFADA